MSKIYIFSLRFLSDKWIEDNLSKLTLGGLMSDLLKSKPYRRYSDYHDYAVVLKDNKKVLGWGTVSIPRYNEDKKYFTISNIFVDEAYRGLGYGTRILDSVLRFSS